MKKTIALLLIVWVCLGIELDPNYSYDDFCKQFDRTYEGEEKESHRIIFEENYQELLSEADAGKDVKITTFLDWNSTQLNNFFNLEKNGETEKYNKQNLFRSEVFTYPSSFDWRDHLKVTPVKNQGQCGSCWTFSSVAHLESLFLIYEDPNDVNDFAEQYPLQCELNSHGCNGGDPYTAVAFLLQNGAPPEEDYVYAQNDQFYPAQICTAPTNLKKFQKTVAGYHLYDDLTTEQIKQQLYDHGPLSVGVSSSHHGFMNSAGIVDCSTATSTLDHAILLVGYTEEYWVIKNSWGTIWGSQGYAYIPIENDCLLSTYVLVVEVEGEIIQTDSFTADLGDSYGDGWNYFILGVKQSNKIVSTFGEYFTDGSAYSQAIIIQEGVLAEIVVLQYGAWSEQISFQIRDPSGNVVTARQAGRTFASNEVLGYICYKCAKDPTVTYSVLLTDIYGDGWSYNILYLDHNDYQSYLGLEFTDGHQDGPLQFTYPIGANVTLGVYYLGYWSEEIGLQIRNEFNDLIFERVGSFSESNALSAGEIITTFCVECFNLSPVRFAEEVAGEEKQEEEGAGEEKQEEGGRRCWRREVRGRRCWRREVRGRRCWRREVRGRRCWRREVRGRRCWRREVRGRRCWRKQRGFCDQNC